MKKLVVWVLLSLLLAGCNVENKDKENMRIQDYLITLGYEDESDSNVTKLSYSITIAQIGNNEVLEEDIQVVASNWLDQRKINSEVTEFTKEDGDNYIKGFITFGTVGYSKQELAANEPFIIGVNVNMNEESVLLEIN